MTIPNLWCVAPGCRNRHVSRSNRCFEHDKYDDSGLDRVAPAPRSGATTPHEFDVVCLQCSQRRTARGSEADAAYTRLHLGPCAVCRGPLVVERADLGGISSPSQGHSVTYYVVRAGRYGGAA